MEALGTSFVFATLGEVGQKGAEISVHILAKKEWQMNVRFIQRQSIKLRLHSDKSCNYTKSPLGAQRNSEIGPW